jgi:hypothetical protein
MRVKGAWLSSEDGETRPIVPGLVRLTNNQWLEVSFLLDAGADRSVFSARFLQHLQDLESNSPQILLSGVGGGAESITVETAIAFARDDGQLVTVRGTYGVFTKGERPRRNQ